MPIVINDRIFIDPKNFTEVDLPIAVLIDDMRSFSGWAIKSHTNGNYNHAFIMHRPGMLVSQNFTGFAENKIDVYMQPNIMMKFWRIKNLQDYEKTIIQTRISNRLSLPWWRRTYDFLGTFVGQFLHIKWLQNPFAEFCSEEVNDDYINSISRGMTMGIKEPSPSELNTAFVTHPEVMECIGYWWSDD